MRQIKKILDKYVWQKLASDPMIVPWVSFWARLVLSIRHPLIIGITGSVGKTTTKEMISTVLMDERAQRIVGPVGKSDENMNNDIGLPLAVLRCEDRQYAVWLGETNFRKLLTMCRLPFRALALAITSRYPKILVLEYAMGWKGHPHQLAKLAPPNIGVVTTIGPAHLERLKTIEGIVHEKSAVVGAVPPSGLVVLGQDHNYVENLERASRAPVIKVTGRGLELSQNIASVVCQHLGIPNEIIHSTMGDFKLPKGRLNRLEFPSLTIIDDSFNANPLSMRLGLDILGETATPGQRRVAILGAMAELGDRAAQYHEEVGAYARNRADLLLGVGDLGRHYNPDHWFASLEDCLNQIEAFIRPGDCVFVKGSASAQMPHVVRKLRELAEARVQSAKSPDTSSIAARSASSSP